MHNFVADAARDGRDRNEKSDGMTIRWQTAVHEAGHAVAGIVSTRILFGNNYGFDRIRLNNTDAPLEDQRGRKIVCVGLCEGSKLHIPHSAFMDREDVRAVYRQLPREVRENQRQLIEWQLIRDLAGGAAVLVDVGCKGRDNFRWSMMFDRGNHGDFKSAELLIADLQILTGRMYGEFRYIDRARALVSGNLAAIRALAAELERTSDVGFDRGYTIVSPLLRIDE
jgi:hypothetical protein